jgi:O-antigen/teichoic acid export membrane protein
MTSQAILVSAHVTRLALSLAIASLLGRKLAPADFGFVALVSSIYIVAVEILDMGTTAVATREIAAQPARERESLTTLLALRRLLSAAVLVAVIGLAFSDYVERNDHRIVLVAAACGLFLLHLHAYQLVFQVRQAYGQVTAMALATQVGFLLASAAALQVHAGGAVIGLLVVGREFAQVLGSRWVAVRQLGYRLRAPWLKPAIWPLLKAGWMIGVAGLSYKLATYSGGFILWSLAAPEALASFNAAQRLLVPMSDMAWLFAAPLMAAMSGAVTHGEASFRVQLEGYVKLLLVVSTLVAVAGYFLAPFVLRLLYGELYAAGPWSAVGVFRWLALACLFALVSPVLIVGEMARGHAVALLSIGIACLGLNLAGNAWAIPMLGAEGAAIVLASCEAFVLLVLLARSASRRELRFDRSWVAYIAPAALLGVALWLLVDAPLGQLAIACAWAPASLLAIMQLPAQKACRASLAMTSAHWKQRSDKLAPSTSGRPG